MTLDTTAARHLLQQGDLRPLFNLLGWDNFKNTLEIPVDGVTYSLTGVAEKRGVQVFQCGPGPDGKIPGREVRAKLDTQLRKSAHEHLLIFVNGGLATEQLWQWADYAPGKPRSIREHRYSSTQSGESLVQKFGIMTFSLGEEEELTLLEVRKRTIEAFGRRDKVTKKFYERFQKEHQGFLGFIEGIAIQGDREWYASVMLNRLMFVYFIEKKGFLDGDHQYLRHRLATVKQKHGDRQFFGFYRSFLRRLFHEGLGASAHSAELEALIGKVPYLNGGIFDVHQLERDNPDIDISDAAFERLFDFFDDYDWHLDDRPLHADNEINPDVLGYIFEKYINQKQMGAYYTKEDITEYISKNTVLPFLLDATKDECRVAFEADGSVWRLLREDPDRYIYDAVRKGVDEPLPAEVEAGIADVSKRGGWNRAAPAPFALPTETWREHVARRTRCLELRRKLAAGEVTAVNDLITLNLNIRQFTQDVIERSEGRDVVRAFYLAMSKVSVLDPTCGSGAFLFAALNILQPLYDACLDRMEAWIADEERLGRPPGKEHLFRKTLEQVAAHPNREYFVLKSIIIDNLFGVDIMEEAVEICKLRLFLKLVAQVQDVGRLEPLPDIDFNIRAGNTLVGFTSLAAVREAMTAMPNGQSRLPEPGELAELRDIEESAEVADRAYQQFREQQTNSGGVVTAADKRALRERLHVLDARLDQHLARQYGVDPASAAAFLAWQASHQPFHWFVEFYGVMSRGGFDAIIGNPPYVEYKDVQDRYRVRGYLSAACGDLYAYVMERTYRIASGSGAVGLIVPISVFGTDGFESLQALTLKSLGSAWVNSFANRPSQIFEGAQKRLTVILGRLGGGPGCQLHTGAYLRWTRDERNDLIAARIHTVLSPAPFRTFPASLEKLGSAVESSAYERVSSSAQTLEQTLCATQQNEVFYTRKFGYFLAFLPFVPSMVEIQSGKHRLPSELKSLSFPTESLQMAAVAVLSSSLFFWLWNVLSDRRNLNRRELLAFPMDLRTLDIRLLESLHSLGERYVSALKENSRQMVKSGLRIETFNYAVSKPIIDEIDRVLAQHYGFTDEELDFIINYDIKYRMGADSGEDE